MGKCCGNCNHWKNQNGPVVEAFVNDEEVGACFKLNRSLTVLSETDTKKLPIQMIYVWPKEALYTVASFSCRDHTDKTIKKSRRTT
jgi:hypothetical protein